MTSQKRGPPENMRSNRLIRFAAPAAVRGGKNSREKKGCLLAILALIDEEFIKRTSKIIYHPQTSKLKKLRAVTKAYLYLVC